MNTEKKDLVKKQALTLLKYTLIYLIPIIYWELLMRTQIGFERTTLYFLFFLPAEALFLATLTGWLAPKINRILTTIVLLIPFAFYVSQLIYFRIFGSVFSVSMIGMGADAVGNFGWALRSTIEESIGLILLCFLPVAISIFLSFCGPDKLFRRIRPLTHLASLLGTVLLWVLAILMLLPFGKDDSSPYKAYTSPYIDSDTAADRLGVLTNSVVELGYKIFGSSEPKEEELLPPPVIPEMPPEDTPPKDQPPEIDTSPNQLQNIDFEALKALTDDEGKKKLCEYYAGISGTNKNEYTGLLQDYNLIYICAEAFCKYAIDPNVTPTLYKMSTGGILLNNYYNSFKNTTTNGEFAFMTGLWPDVSRKADAGSTSGSFAQSADKLIPFALGNMFEANGIKSYAFHNFYGYYYSRETTHPNLGYSSARFMGGRNGMKFTTSWPASDYEMMQQSVDDYIADEQFHAYYMTFSGHGPYSSANPICEKNIAKVRELLGNRKLSTEAEYYLAANYELELAMAYLFEKLEEAGKLDNTLIVISGDHHPYYLKDASFNTLVGKEVEQNFEKYLSSCLMWCGGIEPIVVDAPCCNVDIVPTILNLFGFEYDSRLLPGTDVFSSTTHIAMLYNKSFVTPLVKYNSQNGKAEWTEKADNMPDKDKQEYLDYCIALTKSRYTASLELMNEDFFRFVFENIE